MPFPLRVSAYVYAQLLRRIWAVWCIQPIEARKVDNLPVRNSEPLSDLMILIGCWKCVLIIWKKWIRSIVHVDLEKSSTIVRKNLTPVIVGNLKGPQTSVWMISGNISAYVGKVNESVWLRDIHSNLGSEMNMINWEHIVSKCLTFCDKENALNVYAIRKITLGFVGQWGRSHHFCLQKG